MLYTCGCLSRFSRKLCNEDKRSSFMFGIVLHYSMLRFNKIKTKFVHALLDSIVNLSVNWPITCNGLFV